MFNLFASQTAHLSLRTSPEQEAILRRASEAERKSLADFILDSACQAAEQTLLDQYLSIIPNNQAQTLMNLIDHLEQFTDELHTPFPYKTPDVK